MHGTDPAQRAIRLFGNYNHALLGHEGYFKLDFVGSSRSVLQVVSMEDIAQR